MAQIHAKTLVRSDRRIDKIAGELGAGCPELSEGLHQQLGRDGWDVPRECLEPLHRSLLRVLEARNRRLADAVRERQDVANRGRQCRALRDEASREVYGLLVQMRQILHATIGPRGVRAHFGPGKTPREPREVWRLASNLRAVVRDDTSRRHLCGTIGSEDVLLNWARELEEPLSRLGLHLRQVGEAEVAERRTVPAVRRAKAEMRETQKFAYRLLEGLFGLAGMAEVAQTLRLPEPVTAKTAENRPAAATAETPAPRPAEPQAADRTETARLREAATPSGTPAARPPANPPTTGTESPRRPEEAPTTGTAPTRPPASPPATGTTEPGAPTRLRTAGSTGARRSTSRPPTRTAETIRPEHGPVTRPAEAREPARGRSKETVRSRGLPDPKEVPDGTAPAAYRDTESPDATESGVKSLFRRLRTIPHRWRNPGGSGEIAGSEERAA